MFCCVADNYKPSSGFCLQPYLSVAPQKNRVVLAVCCTPVWHCCRRWGHQHLLLSPATLTYLQDRNTDMTKKSGGDSSTLVIWFRNGLTNKLVTKMCADSPACTSRMGKGMKNTLLSLWHCGWTGSCGAGLHYYFSTFHHCLVETSSLQFWWFSCFK